MARIGYARVSSVDQDLDIQPGTALLCSRTERSRMERRLATIMAADVVGYSARMQAAEQDTIGQLAALTEVLNEQVSRNGGRVFSRAGDGFLSEFASPVSAVRTGFEIQRRLRTPTSSDGLQLRMGIHLADVVVDGNDLLGEGV